MRWQVMVIATSHHHPLQDQPALQPAAANSRLSTSAHTTVSDPRGAVEDDSIGPSSGGTFNVNNRPRLGPSSIEAPPPYPGPARSGTIAQRQQFFLAEQQELSDLQHAIRESQLVARQPTLHDVTVRGLRVLVSTYVIPILHVHMYIH